MACMASLREALERIGVRAKDGLRVALESYPPSLLELIRVATLPRPRLDDLEPDAPTTFESFELDNAQGIAHGGGTLWFLSSESTIRRCRIEAEDPFRPTVVVHGVRRNLDELLDEAGLPHEYDHLGDLGFADSVVYVPVRRSAHEPPHLLLGLSTTLQVIGWAELSSTTGESACAVSPWNALLHLPDKNDDGCLEAYDISPFADRLGQPMLWGRRIEVSRRPWADIQLRTLQGARDLLGMQGVAFSANGRIYVTRTFEAVFGTYSNHIYVYSALTGRRLDHSRKWDFSGSMDEIEGIVVHPSGVLYLVVADNNVVDTDDFDLYTLRFKNLVAAEV
jgi:hypothetical protein